MRLKLLADPPERNAWSQPQNLSKDKPLFEARRMHYRRRSRKGTISMNIHMETTMLSARDVDMERSPTSTDGTTSHADRSISNA